VDASTISIATDATTTFIVTDATMTLIVTVTEATMIGYVDFRSHFRINPPSLICFVVPFFKSLGHTDRGFCLRSNH